MTLTHRQIDVFRAVMQAGQVTGAAQALNSSQPTLSRELSRLESQLGLVLFDRVRGRLHPTASALMLMAEVERAYLGLDHLSATAAALRREGSGRLHIACLPALAHALLPEATRRFVSWHPDASVSLTPVESPLLEQWLSAQRFDLGLTEHTDAPPGTLCHTVLAANEVAVLPAHDPLLSKASLSLQDFADRRFISLAPEDPYRRQIDQLFVQANVARQLGIDTSSAVSVCAMVQQGLGLAIVNPLTALAMASDRLHLRALDVAIPFQIAQIRPELRPTHPMRAAFERALMEAAADMADQLQRLAPTFD